MVTIIVPMSIIGLLIYGLFHGWRISNMINWTTWVIMIATTNLVGISGAVGPYSLLKFVVILIGSLMIILSGYSISYVYRHTKF